MSRGLRLVSYPILALLAAGCVTTQKIAFECVPKQVTVYVDGRALEEVPDQLKLEKDQPHTVFFKGGGYHSQMVVLESSEVDGKLRLEPADLCNEVAFVAMDPVVHMEPEVSDGPPAE